MIQELKKIDIDNYIDFIREVFDYDIKRENIEKLIKKNKVLIIKESDDIVASAILEERFEYIKNSKYYFLSYLGVRKQYRRMGYASVIINEINRLALENNIKYLELNSGNQRKSAYYLYQKNNFKIKDTTVFVKFYN